MKGRQVEIIKILSILGGSASYSEIKRRMGISDGSLVWNLNILIDKGIVEKVGHGGYRLLNKTYQFLFSKETPVTYVGMLGRRMGRVRAEPDLAVSLLRKCEINVENGYVITTLEAYESWKKLEEGYRIIFVERDDLVSIGRMVDTLERLLGDIWGESAVVLDCTSLTKPATIAFYKVSEERLLPLIYIYEDEGRLVWLKDRESILRSIGYKG